MEQQNIDFRHDLTQINGQNTIVITDGEKSIIMPESELIRLFGWYFELEDHNAVLEFVEKVDR